MNALKIEIDFNHDNSAIKFYSDHKESLDQNIIDAFEMGNGPISNGDQLRLPTIHLANNNSISAINLEVYFFQTFVSNCPWFHWKFINCTCIIL